MREWLVKYTCHHPLGGRSVGVVEHFDAEDCLREFCWECAADIVEVIQLDRYPLRATNVTEDYLPRVLPSTFDREASDADHRLCEMKEELR